MVHATGDETTTSTRGRIVCSVCMSKLNNKLIDDEFDCIVCGTHVKALYVSVIVNHNKWNYTGVVRT